MTQFASTNTVRRTPVSIFGALILIAALPQAGLAATSDDGLWKINPAKSSFGSGSATLAIERAASANPGAGSFIVVAKGSVYLVKRASDSKGLHPTQYAHMTSEGSATLIGTNARSADTCGFRCQGGLAESRIRLTFRPVEGSGQQINDMLAHGN